MSKYLFLFIFVLVSLMYSQIVFAQQVHPQKHYVNEDGRLFWPLGQPLYLFITDKPDVNSSQLVKSERSAKQTNPFYFGKEGLNYFRSKWAKNPDGSYLQPMQDVLFEIYVDGTPPRVSVDFVDAKKHHTKTITWYGPGLKLVATAIDTLSGVDQLLVERFTDGFTILQGNTINITSEMEYLYRFYSVDNVGNTSSILEYKFRTDFTPPSTYIAAKGDVSGQVISPRTKIELSTTDAGSQVYETYYSIDEGEFQKYSNQIGLEQVSEGEHLIRYYSVDNVGNKESEKEFRFYLDRSVPTVTAGILGDQYQNRGRVFVSTRSRVKLQADDNRAGVQKLAYQIDGGEIKSYSEPFDLPRAEGKHEILYYAIDRVNNNYKNLFDESKHGRQALNIDMKAPDIGYAFVGPKYFTRDTMFISSKTQINLKAEDNDSGVKKIGYKLNDTSGQDYSEPITISVGGYNRVDYYATDQVNNRNVGDFRFFVDNEGPTVQVMPSMKPKGYFEIAGNSDKLPIYTSGVKIYLAATDDVLDTENVFFSLNNTPEQVYIKPIVLTNKGINQINIRAIDKLGNETRLAPVFVYIQ